MDSSSSSSSSNPTITHDDELDRFLDAPDEFYYDCMPPTRRHSHRQYSSPSANPSAANLRRRNSAPHRNSIRSDVETEPSSSSSNGFKVHDAIESTKDLIDVTPEKDNDFVVTESGQARVDPFQESREKTDESMDVTDSDRVREGVSLTEESTVTTVSDDREHDNAGSSPPELREPNQTEWSLLGYLVGLVLKAIEFQFNLFISLVKYPPLLLHWCFLFFFDPFSTIRLGRRFITTVITNKLSWFEDTKRMLNVACKCGWGLFYAVYVGAVLFGLLLLSLMLGGFMINRVADKPFVLKEVLNFDYTKNSPEAFVSITSCDGSCKESNEMLKIRGVRAIPRDHKLEITLSMTVPESEYNKNLGMFQVRVDFLSADGQTLNSIRRPCMLRFRSEPIRLVQTCAFLICVGFEAKEKKTAPMADPELEAIRQRRMQELMAQHGTGKQGSQQNPDQERAQEDAKREADERRQMMLSQILSSQARERIARIALVKPEKARGVEDVILRAAQMGQIVEKVSEERLITLLEQINSQTTKQTKVTIQRRRGVDDD
ncbi:seipin-2 isoform X2 [Brassica rapa]|uniref:seipin-2 isoform X2 n=1 Tax=Brassica campestris TaxID=3711 RepID=UPI00142DD47C|nr:seipin-2 isoform X2 [Brassica rapa]